MTPTFRLSGLCAPAGYVAGAPESLGSRLPPATYRSEICLPLGHRRILLQYKFAEELHRG